MALLRRLAVLSAADRAFALLCALFVALALSYAAAMPPFEASDEAAHVLYVHGLLTSGALPVIPDREAVAAADDPVARWSLESHQPPLYYALGALVASRTTRADIAAYLQPNGLIFLRGLPQDNANKWLHPPGAPAGDTDAALWRLRLLSLALSLGTLTLIYRTARLVLPPAAALTAPLLVACMPTYIAISGSVNNDNLVTLLYAAGTYQTARLLRDGVTRWAALLLGLTLAAAALTKITGLTLFGVVGGGLLIGVWRGRFSLRAAVGVGLTAGALTALLAGWWYARNWALYGDPLAVAATGALWGRDFSLPTESGDALAEIGRVWRSFWMMMGHLHWPVWGAGWLYVYVTVITAAGAAGWLLPHPLTSSARKRGGGTPPNKSPLRLRGGDLGVGSSGYVLLALAAVLPVIVLALGTRSVDISYGRLLFPALVGFAPLLVIGWRRLVGRYAPLLVMPLAALALLPGLRELPQAYPRLTAVAAPPAQAIPLNAASDGLTLLAYTPRDTTVRPGETARFWLYLTGAHPDNPALFATLLDPLTGDALGRTAVYPGSAPTDALPAGQVYRAPLRVRLDPDAGGAPRLLRLQLGWQPMLTTDYLPLTGPDGAITETLVLDAGLLRDPAYRSPAPGTVTQAIFSDFAGQDVIALTGYTLATADDTPETLVPGDTLRLTLHWAGVGAVSADYVVTTQLLSADGVLIAQDDGEVAGFPTRAWRAGVMTTDARVLRVPDDAAPGTYRLAVGWYRLDDFARLPVRGAAVEDGLALLPLAVTVGAANGE